MDAMNGVDLDGRNINVRLDRSTSNRNSAPRNSAPRRERKQAEASPALYFGSLAWATTTEDLQALLSQYDIQSAEVVMGYDGRSRGYGLVNCSTTQEAESVIAEFNNTEFQGRTIVVRFSDRSGGSSGSSNRNSAPRQPAPRRERKERKQGQPSQSLFFGGLAWATTTEDLQDLLRSYQIQSAEVVMGYDGRSRGYALVSCSSVEEAEAVIAEFNSTEFQGRSLRVRFDSSN
jgi:RNA recognition motif-containing protein